MAGRFLTLSLFVVLLSFFIVLNSISHVEERKSQIVSSSVAQAFTLRTATVDSSKPDMSLKTNKALSAGTTLDKIESLFTENIAGIETAQNRLGTIMQMKMSVKKFEKLLADSSAPQINGFSSPSLFLQTLVTIMDTQDKIPYRMDIILKTPGNPANLYNEDSSRMSAPLRRVANYAEKVEEFGLPSKLVTAGIIGAKEESIQIIFRRYQPLNIVAKMEVQSKTPPATPEQNNAP